MLTPWVYVQQQTTRRMLRAFNIMHECRMMRGRRQVWKCLSIPEALPWSLRLYSRSFSLSLGVLDMMVSAVTVSEDVCIKVPVWVLLKVIQRKGRLKLKRLNCKHSGSEGSISVGVIRAVRYNVYKQNDKVLMTWIIYADRTFLKNECFI